jgi:hypothetical protein
MYVCVHVLMCLLVLSYFCMLMIGDGLVFMYICVHMLICLLILSCLYVHMCTCAYVFVSHASSLYVLMSVVRVILHAQCISGSHVCCYMYV